MQEIETMSLHREIAYQHKIYHHLVFKILTLLQINNPSEKKMDTGFEATIKRENPKHIKYAKLH